MTLASWTLSKMWISLCIRLKTETIFVDEWILKNSNKKKFFCIWCIKSLSYHLVGRVVVGRHTVRCSYYGNCLTWQAGGARRTRSNICRQHWPYWDHYSRLEHWQTWSPHEWWVHSPKIDLSWYFQITDKTKTTSENLSNFSFMTLKTQISAQT